MTMISNGNVKELYNGGVKKIQFYKSSKTIE